MAWLPEQLMTKSLKNEKMWSQHVKQFLILTCGIETKSQEELDKGGRENFMMEEYSRWVDILSQKFPDAAVHPWLNFTTGTRKMQLDGGYLYRNFQEGLRIFTATLILYGRPFFPKESPVNPRKKCGLDSATSTGARWSTTTTPTT